MKYGDEEYKKADKEGKLTDKQYKEGWFFCCEWDEMLIHKDSPEAQCCTCRMEKGEEK